MAGRYKKAKYETDDGNIHPIRVQPETVTTENPEPTGGITNDPYVRVSGSKRAYGIKARHATYALQIGDDAPYNGGSVYARVPYLLASALIALNIGSTITYQGKAWTVISKTNESNR